MTRIISTGDTPAKRRHAHIRSCAEVLRLLSQREYLGAEERDMLAFLVISMRGIYKTIDESAAAWDKRNYWKKSEALREKWRWSKKAADQLEKSIFAGIWPEIQMRLIDLIPHFASVNVQKMTRDADWWCGAFGTLNKK